MSDGRRLYYVYGAVYFGIALAVYYFRVGSLTAPLNIEALLLSALSAFTPAFLFNLLVNRYLWRFRVVRRTLGINRPMVHGRWIGYVRSSWSKHAVEHPIVLEFWQTLDEVHVWYYDENAITSSILAGFSTPTLGGPARLYCIYNNQPIRTDQPKLQAHNGVMELVIEPSERSIGGIYYNNPHQRNTYGYINVKKVGKRPVGQFAASD